MFIGFLELVLHPERGIDDEWVALVHVFELIKVDEPIVVVVATFYKATCLVRSVPGESDEGPDFCRIFQLKS